MNTPDAATARTRTLCVSADDFGLGRGINAAVLELAQAGRISAVGCMVRRSAWQEGARALRALPAGKLDVGLHLDLPRPASAHAGDPPLPGLIARALLGRLERAPLLHEIQEQLRRFEDEMGRPPAFVDGHRHVHQLPTVRDVLCEELVCRYRATAPWLRGTAPPAQAPWANPKATLIHALGGRGLRRVARAYGLQTSAALLGVYDFRGSAQDYRKRLAGWLAQCRSGDVLMCHPSLGGDASLVPHEVARRNEFQVLLSTPWPQPVGPGEVELAPLSQRLGAASALRAGIYSLSN